eukprot:Seg1473.10 transcript_id=Seg1473.10/GoldUCD/mRNA.D3Y31 product="hypothetical protein" protein_id=Seg1473.10/GoldUCD/D3Y31
MESKRKFDEKILRENEQFGRRLDQQVKQLDKLKSKFEKRLATEKEKFAVQHLNVSSDFTGRNGGRRKKISLAIDPYKLFSSDSKQEIIASTSADNLTSIGGFYARGKANRMKSLSVPDLNNNDVTEDCLFPPLANDKTRLTTVKSRSQTLSGEESRIDVSKGTGTTRKKRVRHHSEHAAPRITITDSQGDIYHGPSRPRSVSIIFEEFNSTKFEEGFNASKCDEGVNIPLWQHQIMSSMSESSEGPIAMNVPSTNVEVSNGKPKGEKTRRKSKAPQRGNKEDEKRVNSKLSDLTITKDSIAEMNMIKNLSKQQRCDMEQQVTILPPMPRIFSEDLQSCPLLNEMTTDRDTRRLSMAKTRWMKAYDTATKNIYGNESDDESLDKVKEEKENAKQTLARCTSDPRLQRLVSVLSKNDKI